jgi:glycosyltransferase involved in cell wall biosynthesis
MSPRSLRIVYVAHRYLPESGGTELHTYEVAKRLAALGHRITVATTDRSGTLPSRERSEGIDVVRVPAWPRENDYYFAPSLFGKVRRAGADIVHCQGYHTLVAPIGMAAALSAGVPFVVTFHSGGHSSRLRVRGRRVQHAALRPLLARASRLVGVSRFEAEFFERTLQLPRDRFVVIPNGADLEKANGVNADVEPGLIVSMGRLERYKGHHRLIEALPDISRARPDAKLLILGAGPYEQQLAELARRLGCDDRVEIRSIPIGERAELARALRRAQLVAFLSEYEAHSIAALEAIHLRRPVLVADATGLRELAKAGLARSIPLAARPAELAATVVEELENPRVRADVELPTWEACAARLLRLYYEALEGSVEENRGAGRTVARALS